MSKIQSIADVINEIFAPQNDEAIDSIQSCVTDPHNRSARLRCHLSSKEFRVVVSYEGSVITVSAHKLPSRACDISTVATTVKRMIYDIDSQIADGEYSQPEVELQVIDMDTLPRPPEYMDIPVWDQEKKRWYDAEY